MKTTPSNPFQRLSRFQSLEGQFLGRHFACRHSFVLSALIGGVAVQSAFADNIWDGGGTTGNWNEAGFLNWGGNTTPASPTALQFGGTLQLNSFNDLFAAGTQFNGITFNAGAGAFVISGNSINLGGTVLNSSSNNQTINLDLAMLANRTFTTNASGSLTLGGVVSGGFQFIKSGLGTLTFNGSTGSTYSGQTQVSGGILMLDFANMATPTNLLLSTSTIQTGGGEFNIKGKSSGATSQTLGNLTQGNTSYSKVTLNSNSGGGTTLALGSVSHTAGNVTLFDISTSGSGVTTSTGSANTVISAGFIVKDSGGTGLAVKNGSNTNIVRYDDVALATTLASGATGSTTNYSTLNSAASVTLNAGALSLSTLVMDTTNGTRSIDLGTGIKTLSNIGILFRGSSDGTISNGQIGANNAETIIHQLGTGKLTISGQVGSGTANLTKSGTGEVVLSGANSYTGATRLLDGTLTVQNTLGATAINIGGTVGTQGTAPVLNLGVGSSITGGSITISNANGAINQTQNNAISGSTTLTLTSGGTLNLNADNSTAWTSGTIAVTGGFTLGLGNDNALGSRILNFGNSTLVANGGARTIANPITITNGTTTTVGGSNDMTLNGMVTFGGGTNTFLTSNNSATTIYGGGITIRNDTSVAERFPTISNTGSGTMIISGPIVNGSSLDGRLIFGGSGIVNLNAANTYTGTNTVNAGATVKLGNAAALGFGGTVANAVGSVTTVSSGATIDLNGQTVNELIALNGTGVAGGGALINSNTGTPSMIGGGIAVVAPNSGVSGSGYSSAPAVTIADPIAGTTATAASSLGLTSASFDIVSGDVSYTTAPTVTITGGGGIGATASPVLSGGATGTVIGVNITNGGKDYTTAPSIAFTAGTVGSGTVAPTGTGNAANFGVRGISLSGAGTGYTAVPTVSFSGGGGTGAAATASLATVNLASASDIGGAGDITVNAVVSGTSMTKVGGGTLILAGANTYNGATQINGGKLLVNGSTSTGAVTVANTTTVGGTGTIGGAISVHNGGKIAPGTSIGTLAASSTATFATGSSLEIELNASTSDRLNVTGNLNITDATLNITSLVPAAAPFYIIASYGTLTGTQFASVNGLPSGYEIQTNYNSLNQIAIVITGGLTPYQQWATSPPYSLTGDDALPGSDPDKDGVKNILEFGLNSNPTSGSSTGLSFSKIATVGVTPNILTLTIAARNGATFSPVGNRQKSAVVDGITYTIEASNTLADWGGPVVTEVTGDDATDIQTGLPAPGSGWSYKTFRTDGSADSDTADFIRTGVE
ncbi:MAG: autotransporter-associated beta strand repeat-containing protein [Verrucomicrobiota bacterium]